MLGIPSVVLRIFQKFIEYNIENIITEIRINLFDYTLVVSLRNYFISMFKKIYNRSGFLHAIALEVEVRGSQLK